MEFLGRLAGTAQPRGYNTLQAVAMRLMHANQRLPRSRALFLAEQACVRGDDGLYRWRFDPLLRRSLPTLHDLAEWVEMWHSLRLPVMWIGSQDTRPDAPRNHPGALAARREAVTGLCWQEIPETGHNLHHDAPEAAARMIEDFICRVPCAPAKTDCSRS